MLAPHMSPIVESVALLSSFALFVTAHGALALGLIRSPDHGWRGWLVLLPITFWLAPYWGYRRGLRGRVVWWVLAAVAHTVCLVLAYAER